MRLQRGPTDGGLAAALGHAGVLADRELNNAAANCRCDVNDIGIDRTVARSRVYVALMHCVKRDHYRQNHDRDRDQAAARRNTRFARGLHRYRPNPKSQIKTAVITPIAVQTAS
jgi:hypothetical protein